MLAFGDLWEKLGAPRYPRLGTAVPRLGGCREMLGVLGPCAAQRAVRAFHLSLCLPCCLSQAISVLP